MYYVSDPLFKNDEADKAETYLVNLTPDNYMAMHPRFSEDYSVLSFIGSENKFLSHTGNYQLKYFKWNNGKPGEPETAIGYKEEYPADEDEFCGLFGYQMTCT